MKLQLAYNKELELPSLDSYQERIDYIMDNLFESNEVILTDEFGESRSFREFYNQFSLDERTEEEIKQLRERWVGVSRVGSKTPDEHTKNTIDFVTTYILNAKDLSAGKSTHEFKKLKRREQSQRADRIFGKEDKAELKELESNVIHYNLSPNKHNEDLVFFYNDSFEKRIASEIEGRNNEPYLEANDKFTRCRALRRGATLLKREITRLEDEIKDIENKISENYILLNEDVYNQELIDKIASDIRYIRTLKTRIHHTEIEIFDLADDYKQETELVISKEI